MLLATSTPRRWRVVLRIVIRVALLAGGILLFLHFADVAAVGRALKQMSVAAFALALAFDLTFYVVESWRLTRLSLNSYRLGALWRARMVAALLANVLPGMISGEILRVLLIDRYRPGNKLYVSLLLLANRLYGVLALGAVIFVALGIDRHHLPPALAAHQLPIAVACIAILPAPLLLRVRSLRVAMVVTIRKLRGRIKRVAYTVFCATSHFCDLRRWALALGSSTLSNALVVLQFWVVGRAIGVGLTLTEWAICVPLAAIASFLPIGFGSIGPQDATFVIVGRITGHSIERLLAVSVLMHLVQVTATLPGFLFVGDIREVLAAAFSVGRRVARRSRATPP